MLVLVLNVDMIADRGKDAGVAGGGNSDIECGESDEAMDDGADSW